MGNINVIHWVNIPNNQLFGTYPCWFQVWATVVIPINKGLSFSNEVVAGLCIWCMIHFTQLHRYTVALSSLLPRRIIVDVIRFDNDLPRFIFPLHSLGPFGGTRSCPSEGDFVITSMQLFMFILLYPVYFYSFACGFSASYKLHWCTSVPKLWWFLVEKQIWSTWSVTSYIYSLSHSRLLVWGTIGKLYSLVVEMKWIWDHHSVMAVHNYFHNQGISTCQNIGICCDAHNLGILSATRYTQRTRVFPQSGYVRLQEYLNYVWFTKLRYI